MKRFERLRKLLRKCYPIYWRNAVTCHGGFLGLEEKYLLPWIEEEEREVIQEYIRMHKKEVDELFSHDPGSRKWNRTGEPWTVQMEEKSWEFAEKRREYAEKIARELELTYEQAERWFPGKDYVMPPYKSERQNL